MGPDLWFLKSYNMRLGTAKSYAHYHLLGKSNKGNSPKPPGRDTVAHWNLHGNKEAAAGDGNGT